VDQFKPAHLGGIKGQSGACGLLDILLHQLYSNDTLSARLAREIRGIGSRDRRRTFSRVRFRADNDFAIWNAYSNRFWPAKYLYAKDGTLESTHLGEGAYEETEALIRKLLGIEVDAVSSAIKDSVPVAAVRSPETYLGYSRGQRFSSREDPVKDAPAEYSMPAGGLETNRWAFEGSWNIGSESSAGQPGSSLSFSFEAARVYLVINPLPGSVPEAFVTVDGVPVDGGDVRKGILTLDSDRLYTLYDKKKPGKGVIKIRLDGQAEVYALTFG